MRMFIVDSGKRNGSITLALLSVHHTFTFGESLSCSKYSFGKQELHIVQLCLLTLPEIYNVASSENTIFSDNQCLHTFFCTSLKNQNGLL